LEHVWSEFEKEGIDAEALSVLCDDDLKAVGVHKIGDRAKVCMYMF
jgi:hypothetical protein